MSELEKAMREYFKIAKAARDLDELNDMWMDIPYGPSFEISNEIKVELYLMTDGDDVAVWKNSVAYAQARPMLGLKIVSKKAPPLWLFYDLKEAELDRVVEDVKKVIKLLS